MLQDLSCSFARGQLTALLGGNGSGKTTTLSLLAGLRRPLRGKRFCRTERIGLLPQDPQMLFDRATVRDELREQLASLPEAEQARRMQEMACFCRLEGLLDRHPYDLSGGEQQRAALAKLLLAGPELLLYVWGISAMKDIRRLYQYHGAEHKCINCIEKGRPLTVHNVMRSSRLHKRCGTSFIFFVMLVSIVLFFFIQVDNVAEKVILRILLMPVVAGISYEIIRLAGRTDNVFIKILSAPGMWIQRMTTREPDESMAEVAIASVEAVFDWKKYLQDTFGYEVDGSWMKDDASAEPED